jgi:3-deoxy-D-manno-octulosonic-acid transferase
MREDPRKAAIRHLTFAGYQTLFGAAVWGLSALTPLLSRIPGRLSQGFHHYFGGLPHPPADKPLIWLHAVSLGESLVACALMEEIRRLYPEIAIGFTTTHPGVLATVRRRNLATCSGFFPLDFLPFMARAFQRWQPIAVILVETDFWPGFSWLCRRRRVPLLLANGRLSAKLAGFYAAIPPAAELVFPGFSHFAVISPIDRDRLLRLGVDPNRISVTGNMKIDVKPGGSTGFLRDLAVWKGTKSLAIFGSVHPSEFPVLLPVIAGLLVQTGVKCLLALRNPNLIATIEPHLKALGIGFLRRTSLPSSSPARCLILDTFGELSAAYSLADAAFVGGTIDATIGGHNPLEPMHFGVPVVVGPYHRNFQDVITELSASGGIVIAGDQPSILAALQNMLTNPEYRQQASKAVTSYLHANSGALARTMALLTPFFSR